MDLCLCRIKSKTTAEREVQMETERSFHSSSWNPIKSWLLDRGAMWLNDKATAQTQLK